MVLAGKAQRVVASLGRYEGQVKQALQTLGQQRFPERLWAKDPSLWSSDPKVQQAIRNRLGWLTVTEAMVEHVGELTEFARSVKEAGVTSVVLLGMGGSSLCPEVYRKTFGVVEGFPDLVVLDSTDPATIHHVEQRIDLNKTLLILASKSGTTIEMQSLYRYFSAKLRAIKGDAIGEYCIAVTDPETPLERLARAQKFRKVFLNPPDIGGRYSALSYFGLVPAALIGMDLAAFLGRAEEAVQGTASSAPVEDHPGIRLGVLLGELGKAGRDKVTLIVSPAIGSFGVWVEQLLAESTGKEGKGLVPIEGEAIGAPEVYGEDRVFVYLSVASSPDRELDQAVLAMERAGHPVVRIPLRDPLDLAGELYRWEVATAVAGAILGVNPFDEPNVTESKEHTRAVLEEFQKTGTFPPQEIILEDQGVTLYGNLHRASARSVGDALRAFLDQGNPSDYVALMAYVERSDLHEPLLQQLRLAIRDHSQLATTLGYGPRFLHSTGQLHKGGAGNGLFIQITVEEGTDIPIPGDSYTFGVLKQAQAIGDLSSLSNRGLPVLHIHLGPDVQQGLTSLLRSLGSKRTR